MTDNVAKIFEVLNNDENLKNRVTEASAVSDQELKDVYAGLASDLGLALAESDLAALTSHAVDDESLAQISGGAKEGDLSIWSYYGCKKCGYCGQTIFKNGYWRCRECGSRDTAWDENGTHGPGYRKPSSWGDLHGV